MIICYDMSLRPIYTFSVPLDDTIKGILNDRGRSIGGLMHDVAMEAYISQQEQLLNMKQSNTNKNHCGVHMKYKQIIDHKNEIIWTLEMHAGGKDNFGGMIYTGVDGEGDGSKCSDKNYVSYGHFNQHQFVKIPAQFLATGISTELIKQGLPFSVKYYHLGEDCESFKKSEAYRKVFAK